MSLSAALSIGPARPQDAGLIVALVRDLFGVRPYAEARYLAREALAALAQGRSDGAGKR